MKIIQVMPEFLFGGAEIMCKNLSISLSAQGHQVIIISLYSQETEITKDLENSGIKVYYLDKKPGLDISMIGKIREILLKEKPDIIHTHRYVMEYVVPAALFLNIKKVHTVHSIATKENTKICRVLNYFFFRINNVTPVALSNEVQRTIIEEYHLKKASVPVILNGIPLDRGKKKENYILHDPIRLLHIGRFTEAKNHVEMLKATKILEEKGYHIALTLVGDGELKDKIKNAISDLSLGEAVYLAGTTNNVYEFLEKADVFILPSIYEGIPMTLIEAMSCAIPIVASRVGGIPDMLIDGESARFCDATAESIAEALETVFQSENTRKKIGEKAYDKSEDFSSDVMAERYISLYKGIG